MLIDPRVAGLEAPAYCEAYPALKLVGVRRAWLNKLQIREWRDEQLALVARVDVLRWNDTWLEIWSEWVDPKGKRISRREWFDLIVRPTITDRRMPYAICPTCTYAAAALYLKGDGWACADCHKLVPLATLLTQSEKILMQVRRLFAEVHGRPPPTRGYKTWDRKRRQFQMLEEKARFFEISELREHLRARVDGTWLEEPGEEDLERLRYRTAAVNVPKVSPWFGQK